MTNAAERPEASIEKSKEQIQHNIYSSLPLGLSIQQRMALVIERGQNIDTYRTFLSAPHTELEEAENNPVSNNGDWLSGSNAVRKVLNTLKGWGVMKYLPKAPEIVESILKQLTQVAVDEDDGIHSKLNKEDFWKEAFDKFVTETEKSNKDKNKDKNKDENNRIISDEEYDRIRQQSKQMAENHIRQSAEYEEHQKWEQSEEAQSIHECVKTWNQLSTVFGEMGIMLGRGVDFSKGVLQSQGWKNIERLNQILAKVPELGELLEVIGRMRGDDADTNVMETIFESIDKSIYEPFETVVNYVPEEICGITSGDSIERMIGSEYTLLASKKKCLRMLFHVRRIERSLLQYEFEGRDYDETRETTEQGQIEVQKPKNVANKLGPIIICLDTSGSMHGTPEQICKALALQALKIAQRDQRELLLINWSGPGNCQALELSMTPEGLQNLINLLLSSFSGGTDVYEPVQRALEQIRKTHNDWNKADVLMVSDGLWNVPSGMLSELEKARKEFNVRFHGVLVGAHGDSHSFNLICDPGRLHVFKSWNTFIKFN